MRDYWTRTAAWLDAAEIDLSLLLSLGGTHFAAPPSNVRALQRLAERAPKIEYAGAFVI
jgi:hypothetical protein